MTVPAMAGNRGARTRIVRPSPGTSAAPRAANATAMRVRRNDPRTMASNAVRASARIPTERQARRGGAQGPQRPAPGVLRFRLAAPPAVVAEADTELPVGRLSLREKVEVAAAQGDELGGR